MTSTVDAVSWGEFPAPCGSVPSTDFGLSLASAISAITAYTSKCFMMWVSNIASEGLSRKSGNHRKTATVLSLLRSV
jgi:hypothetical protein